MTLNILCQQSGILYQKLNRPPKLLNRLKIARSIITNPQNYVEKIRVVNVFVHSEYNLKVLLIGNSNVGKSCLLLRFSEGKFHSNLLNTIGVDFKTKIVSCDGQRVKLVLWDTAGQERFRTITNSYYRNANGIVIVYDITDRQSFGVKFAFLSKLWILEPSMLFIFLKQHPYCHLNFM